MLKHFEFLNMIAVMLIDFTVKLGLLCKNVSSTAKSNLKIIIRLLVIYRFYPIAVILVHVYICTNFLPLFNKVNISSSDNVWT